MTSSVSNVKIIQAVLEYIFNQDVSIVKSGNTGIAADLYKRLYTVTGFDFYYNIQQYEEYVDFKTKFDKANPQAATKKAANVNWTGQIIVKTLIQAIKMDVKSTDTVQSIKNKIRDKEEVACNLQRVFFKEKQLEDDKPLIEYNIQKGSTLNMILRMTPCIHIHIKTMAGTTVKLEVEAGDTVASVKQLIQDKEGLPAQNQRLVFNGQILRDGQQLGFYDIKENSILYLLLKLRNGNQVYAKIPGGKVLALEISLNEKVAAAKAQIESKECLLANKQVLLCGTKELDDRKTLAEYNIVREEVLEMNLTSKDRLVFNETDVLDPNYDFDFTSLNDDGKTFRRGGRNYERPCGWKRIAFQVKNKYDNELWLGCSDAVGEWPCCYHGCNIDNMRTIGLDGFDLTKLKRLPNAKAHFVTPKMEFAVAFASDIVVDGVPMKFLIKSRVNPEKIIERRDGNYWLIPSADDVRPYGIIYMTPNSKASSK